MKPEEYKSLPDNAGRAKELGLKHYFTGKPCKNGHIAPRYASIRNCVECQRSNGRKWNKENWDFRLKAAKAYRDEKRDEINKRARAHNKKRYWANPELAKKRELLRRLLMTDEEREKRNERSRLWGMKNKEKRREISRRSYRLSGGRERKLKYHHDVLKHRESYKVAEASRRIIKRTLASIGRDKSSSTTDYLGYTPGELKKHLESRFLDGMSWDNYGTWHIDHIVSVSEMVRLGITCTKRINAMSNLRPVWASENLSKGDRFELVAQYQS